MTQAQRDIKRKLKLLEYAREIGNVSKACRHFGISRQSFYAGKRALAEKGEEGLINSKPCPEKPKLRTPLKIEKRILYLRKTYHLGQKHVSWYLERCPDIKVSSSGVYSILVRHDLNRLPKNAKKKQAVTSVMKSRCPATISRRMSNF